MEPVQNDRRAIQQVSVRSCVRHPTDLRCAPSISFRNCQIRDAELRHQRSRKDSFPKNVQYIYNIYIDQEKLPTIPS